MKEILHYNHVTQDILFDGDLTSKPDTPELEMYLQISDYTFSNSTSPYQAAVVMDFMLLHVGSEENTQRKNKVEHSCYKRPL